MPNLRPNSKAQQAVKRREALNAVLAAANMTPSEAAHRAGYPTANAIYNFLNARSASLSQDTVERLARVIPGATIANLTANEVSATPLTPARGMEVVVRAIAQAGKMRGSFDLPKKDQYKALMPIQPDYLNAGAFGVQVESPGFEKLLPNGTILACVPMPQFKGQLRTGSLLIIHRVKDKLIEITVKELKVDGKKAWLWPSSSSPEHQATTALPWPFSNDMWNTDSGRFSVTAVVIGCYSPRV
jgi:hypothetical protein